MKHKVFWFIIFVSIHIVNCNNNTSNSNQKVDWFKHIKLFIDKILPDDLTPLIDYIEHFKHEGKTLNSENAKELASEISKVEGVIVGFMCFGFLVAIVMPFVLLGCCCKACCCKTRPASEKANSSRVCLSFFTFFFILLALPGVVYLFFSSDSLIKFPDKVIKEANVTIDDLVEYFNNTKSNLTNLSEEPFTNMTNRINGAFEDNSTDSLGERVKDYFDKEFNITILLDEMNIVVTGTEQTQTMMDVINNYTRHPESPFKKLSEQLKLFKENASVFCKANAEACKGQLEEAVNSLPDNLYPKNIQLNKLRGLDLQKLKTNLQDGEKKFKDVPKQVLGSDKIANDVRNGLQELKGNFNNLTQKTENITVYAEELKSNITTSIEEQNKNIETANLIIKCLTMGTSVYMAIVWIMFFMGLCLGVCFHQRKIPPEDRTCGSNTGGCLLATAVAIVLFSSIFWLISIVIFPIGAHGEKYVCKPLYDEGNFTFLRNVYIRFPMNLSESKLAQFLPNLTDENLFDKVADIVHSCKNNKPLFEVVNWDSLVNLDDLLNISNHYDIKGAVNKLKDDMSLTNNPVKNLFSQALENLLKNAEDALNDINFDDLKKAFTIDDKIENATSLLKAASSSVDASGILNIISQEKSTMKNFSLTIETAENVKATLKQLNEKLKKLKPQMDDDKESTKTAALNKGIDMFADELYGFAEDYVKHVDSSIRKDIGGCKPAWDLFDKIRGLACLELLDPLNGFWFGLGSSLFFFLPLSMVACCLSKHFRRLDSGNGYYR